MTPSPEEIQRRYYAGSAARYDEAHVHGEDAHMLALRHVAGIVRDHGFTSALDVGAGTGRAVLRLGELAPGLAVTGIEPVAELVAEGHRKGLAPEALVQGDGNALPYPDGAFDVVLETGMLHHVADPARVVAEMLRVARHAVFISDSNRFAQGRVAARLLKLGLWAARLWPLVDRARTRGKGYHLSEGDGLFYSYSVYDNLAQVNAWAERTWVIPLVGASRSATTPLLAAAGPLLNSSQLLLCAVRARGSR